MRAMLLLCVALTPALSWAGPDAFEAFEDGLRRRERAAFERLRERYPEAAVTDGWRDPAGMERWRERALAEQLDAVGGAAEDAVQAAYRGHDLSLFVESVRLDPLSAGAGDWAMAAIVGGTVGMLGGFKATARMGKARLRVDVSSALRAQQQGSRLGGVELAYGRLPLAFQAELGRRGAERLGLKYQLRY